MGWTVLYIAFGIVALWLLGEVLLQYKARLRWRLLAFVGFLGVVVGVLIPSVPVIGLGAAAFAVGQTYVTLSFRRGFAAGWAVSRPEAGATGKSKRRRGEPERQDPVLDASAVQGTQAAGYGDAGADDDYDRDDVFAPAARSAAPTAAETTAVYEPQPMPDETGTYGIYGDSFSGSAQPSATQHQGADQSYAYDYSGYGQQQYGYDTGGQQQYSGYTDAYGTTGYDQTYGGQHYDQQGYGQGQYGTGGYGETPADGVWVPQQRTDDSYGALPAEQPYPYQTGGQQQGHGFDEQYRF
ncbi:hypothetical protein [Streptomyces sp. NPDC001480]|uniref:SCO2102 family sporulation regulator n=1 Tax=Streptomyces sp. NPDC001480 TaxID=3364577 RepID=UPI0036AEEBC9